MKIIKLVDQAISFNIHAFLRGKGYRLNVDYAKMWNDVLIAGSKSQVWTLHAKGRNYLLIKQQASPYKLWILEIEKELITPQLVKVYIEEGKQIVQESYLDYL
ncbi:hypothetical protein [Facklamia lactis]|uniref:hypothetical protein n=1 Tax=Facklamia lactis TaxID=2749967 RepID=UPI0018CE263B|nr:hypothetical protein [Facklamia lactis]MBG9980501.1 hypothetical protein [Facklamia lactis]